MISFENDYLEGAHEKVLKVLHQMWWVYNLKNYFKLQLLEFLLLGGQSIIGLGCLLFFSFVQAENHHYTCFKVVEISVTKRNSLD